MKKLIELVFVLLFSVSFASISKEEVVSICLDAGHGGIDGGCEVDNIKEKDINLQIVEKLRLLFETSGYKVVLTRYGDYDLASENSKNRKKEDMKKRVDIINTCDIFISIHQDKYSSKAIKGAQVLTNDKGYKLGQIVQEKLTDATNTKRKLLIDNEKYLLVNSKSIGCIVETGFLSNDNERNKLISDDYQFIIANAIFEAVSEYIKIN